MTLEPNSLLTDVEQWLDHRGHDRGPLTPLAGDVSPRRYVRLQTATGPSSIVAVYPASMRDVGERFIETTRLLAGEDISVPSVLDWDPDAGMMLLSDSGQLAVHDAVALGADPKGYWLEATAILDKIARLDRTTVARLSRPLDGTTLRRELLQSWDLVLEPAGLVGAGSLTEDFRLALFTLCDRLAEPEPRPCHRDFMARNLLLDAEDSIVVIDHQDLRLGPPWYDLASLLNDTLYADADEEAKHLDQARVPRAEREMYHRAAAQRSLKIVGTFAAFAARGVERHLPLIRPSLRAARRHLARVAEAAPAMRDLNAAWEAIEGTEVPLLGKPSLLD